MGMANILNFNTKINRLFFREHESSNLGIRRFLGIFAKTICKTISLWLKINIL